MRIRNIPQFIEIDILKIILFVEQKEKELFQISMLLSLLNDPTLGQNLLTHPEWEETKNSTPKLNTPLRFLSVANHSKKEFLIKHRYDNARLQHEYDKDFGLIAFVTNQAFIEYMQ